MFFDGINCKIPEGSWIFIVQVSHELSIFQWSHSQHPDSWYLPDFQQGCTVTMGYFGRDLWPTLKTLSKSRKMMELKMHRKRSDTVSLSLFPMNRSRWYQLSISCMRMSIGGWSTGEFSICHDISCLFCCWCHHTGHHKQQGAFSRSIILTTTIWMMMMMSWWIRNTMSVIWRKRRRRIRPMTTAEM